MARSISEIPTKRDRRISDSTPQAMLSGKKIVLGITGSIAAYKIPLLVRLLVREEAEVRVIMTPMAAGFVTPLTLSTLSKNPVIIEPYEPKTVS